MTSPDATPFLALAEADPWGGAKPWGDKALTWAFALIQWPWLLRSLSGGPPAARRRLLERLELPPAALPHLGSWKADAALLHRLVDHIARLRPTRVVEIGVGATSLVAARALQLWSPQGRLVGYDQHAPFVASTLAWLAKHGLEADLRAVPLGPPPGDWPGRWYQLADLPESIDLLVIDGPNWTIHPFVRGAAEMLFPRIPVGGVVLLDDAARPGERVVAARWRRRWHEFEFTLKTDGTKGTLEAVRRR